MKDEEELSRKDEEKDELPKKTEGTRSSQIETMYLYKPRESN